MSDQKRDIRNSKEQKKKKKSAGSIVRKIIMLVALAVFIFAGAKLGLYYWQSHQSEQAFEDLKKPEVEKEEESKEELFARLKAKNEDFLGWVSIDDTKIDYPVMWTPDDPQHYLRLNFDKEYELRGTPFLDGACDVYKPVGNFIIYGHNMKDGTMFHSLESFKDNDFCATHDIVQFDYLEEDGKSVNEGQYKIFAAFYAEVGNEPEGSFVYYDAVDIDTEEEYDDYVNNVIAISSYTSGTVPSFGTQMITLSTCSYHVADGKGRFVVVAYKLDDEQDEE